MKWRLTSRLGRGRIRTTTSSRVSMLMLQPWVQPGQTLAVLSRSQARALCRKSFESSEPDRAEVDHVAGPGMIEGLVLGDADVGAVAPLAHVEDRGLGHVLHEADAPGAEDAAVGDVEDVLAEVLDRIVALGVLLVARAGAALLEHVVLELALAGLVADGAVERMVDEQQLEHALAGLLGAGAVDVHHLAFGHGGDARRHQLGRLLHLDQAHPADRRARQRRVVAVVRHQHAGLLGGLDDRGALRHAELHSVDRYVDQVFGHRSSLVRLRGGFGPRHGSPQRHRGHRGVQSTRVKQRQATTVSVAVSLCPPCLRGEP